MIYLNKNKYPIRFIKLAVVGCIECYFERIKCYSYENCFGVNSLTFGNPAEFKGRVINGRLKSYIKHSEGHLRG